MKTVEDTMLCSVEQVYQTLPLRALPSPLKLSNLHTIERFKDHVLSLGVKQSSVLVAMYTQ